MSRVRSYSLVAGFAVALALVVTGAACTRAGDVPPLERRAQQLNKAVMCPVCPGESIDQSQNPLAVQMRAIVAEKLESGWTEDQIKAYLVEGYGPSVLLEPPRRGFSLIVWALPPLAALGAALGLYLALRAMRRPPAMGHGLGQNAQLSNEERNEYFRRIEAALDRDGDRLIAAEDDRVEGPGTRGTG